MRYSWSHPAPSTHNPPNTMNAPAPTAARLLRFHSWAESTPIRTEVYRIREFSDNRIVFTVTDYTNRTTRFIDDMDGEARAVLDKHAAA